MQWIPVNLDTVSQNSHLSMTRCEEQKQLFTLNLLHYLGIETVKTVANTPAVLLWQ